MKKALIVFLCVLLTGCAPTSGTSAQSTVSQSTPQDSSVQSSDSSSQDSSSGAPDASQDSEEPPSQPDPSVTSGSTENQDQIIEELLSTMTVEEKVGQMFIVRCPEQGAAEKAAEYHLGGYILFRENFEEKTPVQAAEMVRACQAAPRCRCWWVWMKRAGPSTVSADIRLSATRPLLRRRSCTRRAALTRCGKMRWKMRVS